MQSGGLHAHSAGFKPKMQQVPQTCALSHLLIVTCHSAGFKLTVLTVDGPMEVQLPCNLEDDMNIVIENKGVPTPEGRGIHHVRSPCIAEVYAGCHSAFGSLSDDML